MKNKKILWLVCWLLTVLVPASRAQTAAVDVAQGQSFLMSSNLVSANLSFSNSVAVSPTNFDGNFYYAATRLLVLPYAPAGSNFLTRLGFSLLGRNLYEWQAKLPKDANDELVVPGGVDANEFTAQARTNGLPAVAGAITNLSLITDPTYTIFLPSSQTTKHNSVSVDYGDIKLLLAEAYASEYIIYTLNAQNCDAQLTAIQQLHTNDDLTPLALLTDYPQMLTFATTNDLPAAKAAFTNGVNAYLTASTFIRARPANQVNLFNLKAEDDTNELNFRLVLQDLEKSLAGPVVLTIRTNVTVDMAAEFTRTTTVRSLLPVFGSGRKEILSEGVVNPKVVPDVTFGGSIYGLTQTEVSNFLSKHFTIVNTNSPVVTTTNLPNGTYGISYSQTLAASGGQSPYSWTIIAGALPSGLTLINGGLLVGSPTAVGTFNFTVEVSDALAEIATQQLSLTILGSTTLQVVTSSLPNATNGSAYSQTLTASGGQSPYHWTSLSGGFPPGLTLTTNGLISGTPTAAGTSNFTVKVTDSLSATATQALALTVVSPLAVTTNSPTYTTNGLALIPGGSFTMGDVADTNWEGDAAPISVTVPAFFIDTNLVSFGQWEAVYTWAVTNGYGFADAGSGKGASQPVQTVDWFDAVKWNNARSQQAGLTPIYYTDAGFTHVYTSGEPNAVYVNASASGFRLPTEAEWEKAARGGLNGQRFPSGANISESMANYYSDPDNADYDSGPAGFNTAYDSGASPYTSPVGAFPANSYGLHDMAGNVWEWCGDWYGIPYGQPTASNPTGPATGTYRVQRGGGWDGEAYTCRTADRSDGAPSDAEFDTGFRSVTTSGVIGVPPAITTPLQGKLVLPGGAVSFNVTATGTAPLGYQWYFDNNPLAGATSAAYGIVSAQLTNAGTYTVVITNAYGSTSSAATLTVTITTNSVYNVSVNAQANIFGAGLVVPPDPGGASGSCGLCTNGGGVLPVSVTLPAGSVVASFGASGSVSLNTYSCGPNGPDGGSGCFSQTDIDSYGGISGIFANGSGFLVGVFLGSSGQPATAPPVLNFSSLGTAFTNLAPVLGQTFFIGDGLTGTGSGIVQQFTIPAGAATLYLGFADGAYVNGLPGSYDDNSGVLTVAVTVAQGSLLPPAITTPLTNQTAVVGNSVTFSVTAAGAPPLAYQWSFDNTPLPGATNANYHVVSFQTTNEGAYTVTVTNAYGMTSATATLSLPYTTVPFTFTTNNGTITITGYTGTNPVVTVPGTINGYLVTTIEESAFAGSFIASVAVPGTVTNIGLVAFYEDDSLTTITVAANNAFYSATNGVLFDKSQATLVAYPPGLAGSYTIPGTVTSIGEDAFYRCNRLTGVTIPGGVTNVGDSVFFGGGPAGSTGETPFGLCATLATINVNSNNPAYGSVAGILFDKSETTLIQYPAGNPQTACIIPNGVNSLGSFSFAYSVLASVTIPASVTNLAFFAFDGCSNLTRVYFQGNAPGTGSSVFTDGSGLDPATAYYLPGTTGWSAFTNATGIPAVPWFLPAPVVLNNAAGFGIHGNQFGFTASWNTNATVVIQAATNLIHPVWVPVGTNTLTNGSFFFSDPRWTNYHNRYYRLSAP